MAEIIRLITVYCCYLTGIVIFTKHCSDIQAFNQRNTPYHKFLNYAYRPTPTVYLNCLSLLPRFIIYEPRGHYDMFGAVQVVPDIANADVAFLFLHNEGYSTMCGHAVVALGR